MIILGIDPGFSCTGFGIMKKDKNKALLLDYGCLKMSPTKPLHERVKIFHDFLKEKIERFCVNAVAIETPFLGKNAQNFLKLGYLRGIVYLLSSTYNLKLIEFSPKEIKLSLTGFGGASKDQVSRVVLRLFPTMQMPNKLDITDALAVTISAVWSRSISLNS